ncbi:MAG TPA: MFS transporter [Acidobacteriaceae bacterium]|nr:MFS transporter [Acidobacteriaceae bacterium]
MSFTSSPATQSAPPQRGWQLAVASGILGWVLDAFDFFVVIFLFDALAVRFHVSKAYIVYTLTLTLAMRPVGALLFGAIADRFGRKWPLVLCVLYFSAMTILSGLSTTFAMFAIFRGLYGLGMGGYWGIGASYAMECAPVRMRGFLSGFMEAGYSIGYLIVALAIQPISAHLGWRAAFFVGAPIALLIAVLAWLAPESAAWRTQRAASLRVIFRSLWSHGRLFVYLLALMAALLCLSHGAQDLYPDFLKSLTGLASQKILGMDLLYGIPVLYSIAATAGSMLFGYFSEKSGRRIAIVIALVLAFISVPVWAFGATAAALIIGSCAMQAGIGGAWGVIPAHINELSPASVRGLFPGFIYQLGFVIASPATMVELRLKSAVGYSWALAGFEGAVIIFLFFLVPYGPEAHGRDFAASDSIPAYAALNSVTLPTV